MWWGAQRQDLLQVECSKLDLEPWLVMSIKKGCYDKSRKPKGPNGGTWQGTVNPITSM